MRTSVRNAVRSLVAPVLMVALCASTHARALPTFPGEIAVHLELDEPPVCQICHTDAGNSGTAIQPFALALKDRGFVVTDVDTLLAALDSLDADAVDSDDDGATDIEELRAGTDPNVDEDVGPPPPPRLQYGFFGCAGGRDPTVAMLAVALLAFRRRRRSVLTTAQTSANTPRS